MLAIFIFTFLLNAQDDVAPTSGPKVVEQSINEFYDPAFVNGILLSCFDKTDFEGNANDLTRFRVNSMLLSEALSKAFEIEDANAEESIAYLAHSLHETGKFLDFVQVTGEKYCKIDMKNMLSGSSLNTKKYCEAINKCNRTAANAATNIDQTGFGAIQTTSCANFASTISYLNSGEWTHWEIPDKPIQNTSKSKKNTCANQKIQGIYTKSCYTYKTLGLECTDRDIQMFKKFYKSELKKQGREAYLLELLDDRNLIASPCMNYKIKGLGSVKGSVLLARAAVGFFMQKCKGLSGSARTTCVNGGQNGALKRSQIYKKLKSCYPKIRKVYRHSSSQ